MPDYQFNFPILELFGVGNFFLVASFSDHCILFAFKKKLRFVTCFKNGQEPSHRTYCRIYLVFGESAYIGVIHYREPLLDPFPVQFSASLLPLVK